MQSIPTVFAFVDGRPVDGFMGAVPESQMKTFVDNASSRPAATAAGAVDELLAHGRASCSSWATSAARPRPMPRCCSTTPTTSRPSAAWPAVYLAGGDAERAGEVVAMAPADAKDADLDSVRAALALAAEAPADTGPFETRLAADPDDHEARLELAKALAGRGSWTRPSTSC